MTEEELLKQLKVRRSWLEDRLATLKEQESIVCSLIEETEKSLAAVNSKIRNSTKEQQ
jgi:chaperonin cofactor prefoldin